jgi:hypothetical protein
LLALEVSIMWDPRRELSNEGEARAPATTSAIASIPEQSFLEFTSARLQALLEAVGFDDADRHTALHVLDDMLGSWGDRRIGRTPRAACDIGDDHFPIEFSLAFHGSDAEVRVLLETQAPDASMAARWAAGLSLTQRLRRQYGVPLDRLRAIQDLFVPTAAEARYAIWHSFCLRRNHEPKFKVYLNPQAQGKSNAGTVTAEAVRRLGFSRASEHLTGNPLQLNDELKFFSLDLDAAPGARIKVYKAHHRATRHRIEAGLCAIPGYRPGVLAPLFRTVAESDGPFRGLPVTSYLALTSGNDEPVAGAVHFPIRDYVANDQVAYNRIRTLMPERDRTAYGHAIDAFAGRRLENGVGMHAYVAVSIHKGSRRITIYLSPEGYRVMQVSPRRET